MKLFWMFSCLLVLTVLVGCNYIYTRAYFLPEYIPNKSQARTYHMEPRIVESRLPGDVGGYSAYLTVVSNWNCGKSGLADSLYMVALRLVTDTTDTTLSGFHRDLRPVVDSLMVLRSDDSPLMTLRPGSVDSGAVARLYWFRRPYFSPEMKHLRFRFVVELKNEAGATVVQKEYDVILQRYDHRWNDVWGLLIAD